jgi:hypothetical protein
MLLEKDQEAAHFATLWVQKFAFSELFLDMIFFFPRYDFSAKLTFFFFDCSRFPMVWELFLVWVSSYCMPATTGRPNGTEEHVRQNSFMHKHLTLLFIVQFFGTTFTHIQI